MSIRILVIDDEPDFELLISHQYRKRILSGELQFTFARNGLEGLEHLNGRDDPHVVLTDINMPEMDGLTLLGIINEKHPLIIPVIVSAYGDMANIRSSLNRGAFDFITKPIDFDDLDSTLNKSIQEARSRRLAAADHDQLVALQRELDLARTIQYSLLPQTFPPFPHRQEFEIFAEMVSARQVGGDFYDYFLLDNDRLAIIIGDVSGKGVPAALFMAVSKTVLKGTALKGLPPDECIQQVNRLLFLESIQDMFVTTFYGILHIPTGTVTYCNGGHHAPYIMRRGGRIEATPPTDGLVLGIMEYWDYRSSYLKLEPGDTLILYTDGVVEATDAQDDQFTEERLTACLERCSKATCENIVRELISDVKTFSSHTPQQDDITVVSVHYRG